MALRLHSCVTSQVNVDKNHWTYVRAIWQAQYAIRKNYTYGVIETIYSELPLNRVAVVTTVFLLY